VADVMGYPYELIASGILHFQGLPCHGLLMVYNFLLTFIGCTSQFAYGPAGCVYIVVNSPTWVKIYPAAT
jgi:hypothetical protein